MRLRSSKKSWQQKGERGVKKPINQVLKENVLRSKKNRNDYALKNTLAEESIAEDRGSEQIQYVREV